MRFIPYESLGDTPNLIVDGSAVESTKLTLSHWPGSTTPAALADDSSTQIVFRYLDRPELHVVVEAVSNNHFDEDGLLGVAAILDPDLARRHRELFIDASIAGDFQVLRSRSGARLAWIISAFAAAHSSMECAELYRESLILLPEWVEQPERFRSMWEAEDRAYEKTREDLRAGRIHVEEVRSLDLAVVDGEVSGLTALYTAIEGFRVLLRQARRYEFRYRYESWVNYVSRRPLPRVELDSLVARLNEIEGSGLWSFDGIGETTPSLRSSADSRLDPAAFRRLVEQELASRVP